MTTSFDLSRRSLIAAGGLAAAPVAAAPLPPASAVTLVTRPTQIYKLADSGHERTETWAFLLLLELAGPGAATAKALSLDYLCRGAVMKRLSYSGPGLAPIALPARPARNPDGSPASPKTWPLVLNLRGTDPVAMAVDEVRVDLEVDIDGSGPQTLHLEVPIRTYVQQTSLIYPFKGKGIILQGGTNNGGHRNRSGQFALDGMGLDENWSVVAAGQDGRNEGYRGWGRPLLAPADGVVVRARSDRPDQPVPDNSDPKYYAPEFPDGGDPGNHLVIDYGNGEFSMIAHFQAGSMLVKIGDRVRQGQVIGKLGNSGDTSGPHVHHQLQAGPDWAFADALPCRFSNIAAQILDRGSYFEAK